MNSDRAVGSFGLTSGCEVADVTFRSVDHHSGSPWSNTPWTFSNQSGALLWETESEAQNSNANAIRWGFGNTFSFVSGAAPINGVANVGMFKAGSPAAFAANVLVPGTDCCSGGSLSTYCTANGNSANSAGALITPSGTPDVSSNDLSFLVTQLPANQPGFFLMSQTQAFVPTFSGSQGNLCVGSPIVRFNGNVLNSGMFSFVQFDVDNTDLPQSTVFQPGDTWNFQFWYRDVNPGTTSNTSAGVSVTFCQ